MEDMLGLCQGTFQFACDLNGNACSGANNDGSGNSFYLFLFHSTARQAARPRVRHCMTVTVVQVLSQSGPGAHYTTDNIHINQTCSTEKVLMTWSVGLVGFQNKSRLPFG